jgi:hypothetical protein
MMSSSKACSWTGSWRGVAAGLALPLALSACGADASGGTESLETASKQLSGSPLTAHVEAIGEATSLQRSGHSLLAVHQGLLVTRGVMDDFTTQTNTFPEDVLRLRRSDGDVRSLLQRGSPPPGLSYSCAAADQAQGGSFYLFGGSHYLFELHPDFFSSLVVSDDLYRFDVPRRRWTLIEPAGVRPSARSGCTAAFFGGALYMFAGISRFFDVNDELWKFDPELASWTQLTPNGPAPSPRYKPAVALDAQAGKIYYYGGLAFGPSGFARIDDFWVYDIAINQFQQLPNGIQPVRDQGSMGVLSGPDGRRYVLHVGGDLPTTVSCEGFPQLAQATDEVWAYDIEAETWSLLNTGGSAPRIEYHAGVTLNNHFYFAGGWAEEPDPERTCRQEWNPNFYELSLRWH